jgi:hypothetical protein
MTARRAQANFFLARPTERAGFLAGWVDDSHQRGGPTMRSWLD